MPEPTFDRDSLIKGFRLLADNLELKGVIGHIYVIGGAAMILAYDARRITRDINALFEPDTAVTAAVREIAHKQGWPETWLNNQASAFVSRTPGNGSVAFDHPYLQVLVTPADHLLAMKVLAARSVRDSDDIRALIKRLGLRTPKEVFEVVSRFFPDETLPQRSKLLVEDILQTLKSEDTASQ
jgi:hypothetical protein